jgi:hypothetical protein
MNELRVVLGDPIYHDRQPADLLSRLNGALARQFDATENFVAALAVRIEAGRQDVTAANAGQPLPFLSSFGAGWQEWALPRGPYLGIIPGSVQYHEATTTLAAGDRLLACTDGVSEAGAKSGVPQFQHGGLAAFLAALPATATRRWRGPTSSPSCRRWRWRAGARRARTPRQSAQGNGHARRTRQRASDLRSVQRIRTDA